MPFCPTCKYEYREGIEKCPDCDVKLVAELKSSIDDSELVTVATFINRSDAEMARLKLETHDMDSAIFGSGVSTGVYVGFTVDTSGVRLMVRAEDAAQAVKILNED